MDLPRWWNFINIVQKNTTRLTTIRNFRLKIYVKVLDKRHKEEPSGKKRSTGKGIFSPQEMKTHSKHALKGTKSRNISSSDIEKVLHALDETLSDSFGKPIAQKRFGEYLVRVIYKVDGDKKIVITCYRTSKIEKYTNLEKHHLE